MVPQAWVPPSLICAHVKLLFSKPLFTEMTERVSLWFVNFQKSEILCVLTYTCAAIGVFAKNSFGRTRHPRKFRDFFSRLSRLPALAVTIVGKVWNGLYCLESRRRYSVWCGARELWERPRARSGSLRVFWTWFWLLGAEQRPQTPRCSPRTSCLRLSGGSVRASTLHTPRCNVFEFSPVPRGGLVMSPAVATLAAPLVGLPVEPLVKR